MSQIVSEMTKMYRLRGHDFMGYTYRTINDLSYHHIIKREDNGPKTFSNGAVLNSDTSHPYLHLIEERDIEMYMYINNVLRMINDQQSSPTIGQLKAIREVLLQFEREHMDDTNSKGKRLIKPKYIERRIKL